MSFSTKYPSQLHFSRILLIISKGFLKETLQKTMQFPSIRATLYITLSCAYLPWTSIQPIQIDRYSRMVRCFSQVSGFSFPSYPSTSSFPFSSSSSPLVVHFPSLHLPSLSLLPVSSLLCLLLSQGRMEHWILGSQATPGGLAVSRVEHCFCPN